MSVFELVKGRLYQWDTNRKMQISPQDDGKIDEVHFAHTFDEKALPVLVKSDGTADIPNVLLQADGALCVWAVALNDDGRQTLHNATFAIRGRAKPDDYVYTETEILDYRKVAEDLVEAKAELKGDVAAVAAIADGKLDKRQPAADARKLLYIDANGEIRPLILGKGLEIVDGVLRVTAAAAEDVEFIADADGGVILAGVEFVARDDGSVMLDGAAFTAQDDGSVLINGGD